MTKSTYLYNCNYTKFIALTTKPPSPEGCFPASATVKLDNGKTVQMPELYKGDRLHSGI